MGKRVNLAFLDLPRSCFFFLWFFPATLHKPNSTSRQPYSCFSCWLICLIQTTPQRSPSLPRRPLWSITRHSSALTPWPLCTPPPQTGPISIKPDSAALCLYSPCMFPKRVHNPLPQAPITTLHIQVINEVAPVCGVRSKVSLTVLAGLQGQTKVTRTLVTSMNRLWFCSLHYHHRSVLVYSSRGRQRLTWGPLFKTQNMRLNFRRDEFFLFPKKS